MKVSIKKVTTSYLDYIITCVEDLSMLYQNIASQGDIVYIMAVNSIELFHLSLSRKLTNAKSKERNLKVEVKINLHLKPHEACILYQALMNDARLPEVGEFNRDLTTTTGYLQELGSQLPDKVLPKLEHAS